MRRRAADVNVNPLPVQRPIPIWMGAGRAANPVPPAKVLERIGKYADGFMPLFRINPETGRLEDDAMAALDTVRGVCEQAGRAGEFGLEVAVYPQGKDEAQVFAEIDYLRSIGVTDIHVRFPDDPLAMQLDHIRRFAKLRDAYDERA